MQSVLDIRLVRLFQDAQGLAGHPHVVAGLSPGDALPGNLLQLGVEVTRHQDQGRQRLLQHVAVALEQQPEDLLHLVGDQFNAGACRCPLLGDGLRPVLQAQDLPRGQDVAAPQVPVGARGIKTVEPGAVHRGVQQGMGLVFQEPAELVSLQVLVQECVGHGCHWNLLSP